MPSGAPVSPQPDGVPNYPDEYGHITLNATTTRELPTVITLTYAAEFTRIFCWQNFAVANNISTESILLCTLIHAEQKEQEKKEEELKSFDYKEEISFPFLIKYNVLFVLFV